MKLPSPLPLFRHPEVPFGGVLLDQKEGIGGFLLGPGLPYAALRLLALPHHPGHCGHTGADTVVWAPRSLDQAVGAHAFPERKMRHKQV